MPSFTLDVNGHSHTVDAEPAMPLLWILRDILNLTGSLRACSARVAYLKTL